MNQKEFAPETKTQEKNRDDEYRVISAGRRTDGSYRSLEATKMEYLTRTDELIRLMTTEETVTRNGEQVSARPDVVIFLDKSARPLAWLTRDLWSELAADSETGEVPPMPDMKFLNIDRNQWKKPLDPNKTGGYDFNRIPDEQIAGLRSLYNNQHDGSYDAPNDLDDKNILVVDEVRSSGDTLNIARGIVGRAFPNSRVSGFHWMPETINKNGITMNADLPAWYRDDSTDVKNVVGRGVGNRLQESQITHPSQYFLSTRFDEPDQRALRLRDDFKLLVEELEEGTVVFEPSKNREDDDIERRIRKYNDDLSHMAVVGFRKAIRSRDDKL